MRLALAGNLHACVISSVELVAAFRVPVGCQVVDVVVDAGLRQPVVALRPGHGFARQGQEVLLYGGERFDVLHRRQVKAVAVVNDVPPEDGAAVGVLLALEGGRQPPLGDKADLRMRPRDVVPDGVDAGDHILEVRAIGGIDAAGKVLHSIGGGAHAEHRRAREPRIVVERAVHPRAGGDVPLVVIGRQVGLLEEGEERREAPADPRLPVVICRVLVYQHLVRIDGDLRRRTGQGHLHANAVLREHIDARRRVGEFHVVRPRNDGNANLVMLAVVEGEAKNRFFTIVGLLLKDDGHLDGWSSIIGHWPAPERCGPVSADH